MRRRRLLAAGAAAAAAGVVQAQDGPPAPPIDWPEIVLLDGTRWSPASWQGQAGVVVFWATWCPFCRRHNAHVDRLHRLVQGQPVRVLGVAQETDADAVRRHMATQQHGFPVTLEAGQLRHRFTTRRVLPLTCLVDRRGRLLQAIPGEMAEDDVLGLAPRLLRLPA